MEPSKSLNIKRSPKYSSLSQPSLQLSLPEPEADCRPGFLEFFAGCGLAAQGLQAYFRPVWANDICSKKADVYCANHSGKHFHLGSIAEVKGTDLPIAALAWASFPCQDLSLAGQTEGINAARSGLVWEWLRIMDEMTLRPAMLVAENVSGLVSTANGKNYRTLHEALSKRGYRVGAMLIDAARWLPQSRPRVFVLAVLANSSIPLELMSDQPNWLHPEAVRNAAIGLDNWVWWRMPEPPARKQNLSDILEWNAESANAKTDSSNIALIAPNHLARLLEIESPKPFAAPGYRRTRNGRQVLELRFDNVSGCLRTPRGGSSRQIIVIKENDKLKSRLLTVREAARLMGAPETYKIPGTYNDGYKAMGDAVAVPVVDWLGRYLLSPLIKTHE